MHTASKKLLKKWKDVKNKFFDTKNHIHPFGLSLSKKEFENFGKIDQKLTSKQEDILFSIYKIISSNLSINKDKKTKLVTFSYKSPDRFLNKLILDDFLSYSGEYLKNKEMEQLYSKINSLKYEIDKVRNIDLKNKMLELSATIYKRKVFLQTENYSGLQSIIMPEVSHVKEKVAPKRALIVVVACVTGFILSIFVVFLMQFIKNGRNEEETKSSN